jgi:hypothetical protein
MVPVFAGVRSYVGEYRFSFNRQPIKDAEDFITACLDGYPEDLITTRKTINFTCYALCLAF